MKRLTAALALVWALIATATAQVTTNPDITGVGGGGCIEGSACTGTTITATTQFLAPIGSASTPSYAFTGDPTTGFYNNGGNGVVFVSTGSARTQFGSGGRIVTLDGYTLGTSIVGPDVMMTRYATKQLMISGDGTGATTNAGVIVGYGGSSGVFGLWNSGVTPGATNTVLSSGATTAILGGSVLGTYLDGTSINMRLGSGYTTKFVQTDTAGSGPSIIAGTAADNTGRALSISQTWTDGTTSNIGIVGNFDMGATGTATGKLLSLQAGAAGTTEVFSVAQGGVVGAASVNAGGNGFNLYSDVAGPSGNLLGAFYGAGIVGVASGGKFAFSDSATNVTTFDAGLSRIAAGIIGIGTGAAGSTAGTLRAAALSANGSDFTITAANSVSPTSPNRTITISYGGTTYYLAAKTTND